MAVVDTNFATVEQYRQRYNTDLSDEKINIALNDVSMFLRQTFINVKRDIDSEISDGKLIAKVVATVVCSIANRVLLSSEQTNDTVPVASQISETTGQVSLSYTPLNPTADIYLTKNEKRTLGLLWSATTIETLKK
jgi:hypothetical protein